MKEIRYFYVPDAAQQQELPAEEAQHALKVLRLQAGDSLYLMDGVGTFYRAVITLASNKHCLYQIEEVMPQQKTWQGRIHLALAPTKMMERIEWMVEKSTEVGVDAFSFLDCKFSERRNLRTDRIDKIIVAAMKQSRKGWKPTLSQLTAFKTFITAERMGKKYIAHCYEEVPKVDLMTELAGVDPNEEVTILIGPEGDFSIDEVKMALAHGYQSVSLGSSRLRTETAGLMAVAMAQLNKRI